jgi:hypothetical protein
MVLRAIARNWLPEPIKLAKRRLLRRSEGEKFIRDRFRHIHGYQLEQNARTFTEKLYHRMIELNREPNPLFNRLADKYLVREYVAEQIGPSCLIPLIWHGINPDDIPFEELPAKSIAKTNHGSDGNIVLKRPFDRDQIKAKLRGWMKSDYYWVFREAQYYRIKPQILVEHLLDDGFPDGPLDYRFWCFGGKPEVVQVDNHTHLLNAFYDTSWRNLRFAYRQSGSQQEITTPCNFDEMLEIAASLSAPFDFVRIDLYSIQEKVYFGEFTFAPTAGTNKFDPPFWDAYLGDRWVFKFAKRHVRDGNQNVSS